MDDNTSIVITREFNAPVEKVWRMWTEPEMVKKWWGPKDFTAPSAVIDLRVGGKYIFAMQGPAGSQWDKVMYSAGVYKEIVPNKKLVVTDYFSDEHGNLTPPASSGQDSNFPVEMTATIVFEETVPGKTTLTIQYQKPESEEQLKALLNSGMKEGWSSSLDKFADSLV